jgi:hypothetical protein
MLLCPPVPFRIASLLMISIFFFILHLSSYVHAAYWILCYVRLRWSNFDAARIDCCILFSIWTKEVSTAVCVNYLPL